MWKIERRLRMDNITHLNPHLAEIASEFIHISVNNCQTIIPILLLVLLGLSLAKSLIFGKEVTMDYIQLIRGFIILVVVMLYPELMNILTMFISIFSSMFDVSNEEIMAALENIAVAGISPTEENGIDDSWWQTLLSFPDRVLSDLLIGIVDVIQDGITFLIRHFISFLRTFLLAFLYLVGPVALTLSLIPGFQSTALTWIKGFIHVQLWQLTLNVLDLMVDGFNDYALSVSYLAPESAQVPALVGISINMVIVVSYLFVPSLTNYFLQGGPPSNFLGQISSAAATILIYGRVGGGATKAPQAAKAGSGSTYSQAIAVTPRKGPSV